MSQSTPLNRLPRNLPGQNNSQNMPPPVIPENNQLGLNSQLPQGNMPIAPNMGQQMPQQMPQMGQQMPQMGQQMPQMGQQMPQQMGQQMPQMGQQMPQQMPQNENQLVDDILKEIGDAPGQDPSNISTETLNYVMDPSQIPPEKLPGNFLQPDNDLLDEPQPNQVVPEPNGSGLLKALNVDSTSTVGRVVSTVVGPLIVLIICFILSLPQFNRLLFGFLPGLLLESGQVGVYGVLLKAVVGMVVYGVVSYFI